MNRQAKIFVNDIFAGILSEENNKYTLIYNDEYLRNDKYPSISLTLSKNQSKYQSNELFSFFRGLLQEGWLKELSERVLKIDSADEFALLTKNGHDCVGNVSIEEIS